MGIYDRPYMSGPQQGPPGGSSGLTFTLPKPGPAVKGLLIANALVFFLEILTRYQIVPPFEVIPAFWWEAWRYITFQFLHANLTHLLFNMLGLYFLGMLLEQDWGPKRFLVFYLVCGVAAGVAHVILGLIYAPGIGVIGASGGVYGVVLAVAILYPHVRLLLFFFLPMSIRLAAGIFLGIAVLSMISGILAGNPLLRGVSDPAHLGGALMAFIWVWVVPRLRGRRSGKTKVRRAGNAPNPGAWQRRMEKQADEQAEIDRILDKIKNQGLRSLSNKERRKLQEATRRQQQQDRDLYDA